MKVLRSGFKLWICTQDGKKIFGKGPCTLLRGVETTGSMHRSACDMNMAYSKALSIIKNAEKELGYKLLNKEVGGKNGGGSSLTSEAGELIEKYEEFQQKATLEVERIYMEIFFTQR